MQEELKSQAPKPGQFIVIEGPDGTGKTTFAEILIKELEHRCGSGSVVHVRIPNGMFRELLLDPKTQLTPESETMLFLANHLNEVRNVIMPALAQGKHVVMDRYYVSMIAYQGHGRNRRHHVIKLVDEHIVNNETLAQPTLTIFMESSSEIRQKRIDKRRAGDRMELQDRTFHEAVEVGYREQMDALYHDDSTKVVAIKNNGDLIDLRGRAVQVVYRLFGTDPLGVSGRIVHNTVAEIKKITGDQELLVDSMKVITEEWLQDQDQEISDVRCREFLKWVSSVVPALPDFPKGEGVLELLKKLHKEEIHPDYEYQSVEREPFVLPEESPPPQGYGWKLNTHIADGGVEFDPNLIHFMRLKSDAVRDEVDPSTLPEITLRKLSSEEAKGILFTTASWLLKNATPIMIRFLPSAEPPAENGIYQVTNDSNSPWLYLSGGDRLALRFALPNHLEYAVLMNNGSWGSWHEWGDDLKLPVSEFYLINQINCFKK